MENIETEWEGEFPWVDVVACRNHRNSVTKNPCPDCGGPVERFYFESPEHTWANLCGRSAWMEVCFKCKKQIQLEMGIMS